MSSQRNYQFQEIAMHMPNNLIRTLSLLQVFLQNKWWNVLGTWHGHSISLAEAYERVLPWFKNAWHNDADWSHSTPPTRCCFIQRRNRRTIHPSKNNQWMYPGISRGERRSNAIFFNPYEHHLPHLNQQDPNSMPPVAINWFTNQGPPTPSTTQSISFRTSRWLELHLPLWH